MKIQTQNNNINMQKTIEIKNLWFSYGSEIILEDISASFEENSLIGIIGPNGAGKTTLMRLILGTLLPTKGEISVLGKAPLQSGDSIGYVPQHSSYDLSFPITVLEVVLMGLLGKNKVFKRFSHTDIQNSLEMLKKVEMQQHQDKPISSLSGGQWQRTLMARALVGNPKLLILDEPLTGVDICLEFEFYELLKQLKENMTVMLVSHDVGVISRHVDKIACLNKKLFFHTDKEETLKNLDRIYGCPVDIIAHGAPHRVLGHHNHD